MKNENVIEISNLKKKYKLGAIGGGTLKGEIQSRIALKRGKDDPNAKIGEACQYGKEFWALKGINLEVKRGERLGIIGHNGAGKSTMLKLLSRITAPTEGEIQIRGRITSMLEVGTGFHGELTGRENIYMNAAILGMTKAEVDEKIEDIIRFSECEEFIDTPVKRYSSGMYVKLAFSVAAHLNSEIMIMDEVLAVGDVAFQEKCLKKMRELADNDNRTILYVSHNMQTIRKLCDRCVVLKKGKIIYDGEPSEAIDIYLSQDDAIDENIYKKGPREKGEKARIVSAEYTDGSDGKYEYSDKLDIKIKMLAYENLQDMHLRIQVMYPDSSVVGSFFTEEFSLFKDQEVEYRFVSSLKTVPEGEFYVKLLLSQKKDEVLFENFSIVEVALPLSIGLLGRERYNNLLWREPWRVDLGRAEMINVK